MLDSRKGAILRAIVREYVRAGQAVGSKALTESIVLGVSAATVRNDMALLEELGYISRPHPSAGGVPTDLGYRWFIDNWPGPDWPELPIGQQRVIQDAFQSGFHALEEALNATSQLLSEVTESVAVVAAPPARENRLRRLELLARSDGRVGLLLIADTGLVEQGLIDAPEPFTDQQLADLGASLTARLSGEALAAVPRTLAALPDPSGVLGRIAGEVERVVGASVWERIYRGGTANILSREKFSDLETAHGVVGAIERPPVLAALMAEGREPRPGAGTLVVLIGQENPIAQMQVCATILAPYGAPYGSSTAHEGPSRRGMVAVIGPTRMDYPYTISAVNLVVRSLSGLLEELAS